MTPKLLAMFCVFILAPCLRADTVPNPSATQAIHLAGSQGGGTNFESGFGFKSYSTTTSTGGYFYGATNATYSPGDGNLICCSSAFSTVTAYGAFPEIDQIFALSYVQFYFKVASPLDTSLSLHVTASGRVSASGNISEVDSNFEVTKYGNFKYTQIPIVGGEACIGSGYSPLNDGASCGNLPQTTSFSINGDYVFQTNTLYTVQLETLIDGYTNTASAGTPLDPSFALTPEEAASNLYTLEASPAVTPAAVTPEPPSLVFLTSGLLAIIYMAWRRRTLLTPQT